MTDAIETLKVIVTYMAAATPFKQEAASPSETIGSLKAEVLKAFGLAEGQLPNGDTVSYTLYRGKTALTDLSTTLGSIAGDHNALELKLSQQLTQGYGRAL